MAANIFSMSWCAAKERDEVAAIHCSPPKPELDMWLQANEDRAAAVCRGSSRRRRPREKPTRPPDTGAAVNSGVMAALLLSSPPNPYRRRRRALVHRVTADGNVAPAMHFT